MNKIWQYYVDLSPSIKATIILTFLLLIFFVVIRIKLRNHDETKQAKGLILLVEWLVEMMNNLSKSFMGKRWRMMAPYFLYLAIFISAANFSGLIGLTPPTASVSVTLTLGLTTFFLIHFVGIYTRGPIEHFKDFVSPSPLMLPLNLISEIVVPFSLGLRLFGNILSGAIIMTLLYTAFGWVSVVVAPGMHVIFDIAFGLIQTLVFVMLTALFISGKLPEEDLEI